MKRSVWKTDKPPMMPYVTSIMLMLTEKLLMTKNAEAIRVPIIVTSRNPNLLAIALTSGPINTYPTNPYSKSLSHQTKVAEM